MVNNFLNYGIRTFSLFLKTCTPIICTEKAHLDGTMKLVNELYTFLKNEKKKKKLVLRCLMLTVLILRFANEELGMVLIYKGCKFLNKLWCCVGRRV